METGEYEKFYKQWEERLNKAYSEQMLAILENSINTWREKTDTMDKLLKNRADSYDEIDRLDMRISIRQRRALIKKLEGLLAKYETNVVNEVKPHKDDIYRKYGDLKAKLGVSGAFYSLCDWIEGLGYEVSEYFTTDTPQNFDKSYRNWLNK